MYDYADIQNMRALDDEFYNNFYEIFIYYYVNPEVDDSKKYKVHFSHK